MNRQPTWARLLLAGWAACMPGCGSDGDGPAARAADVAALEADFGGPGGLRAFFDASSAETVAHALSPYGIGYVVHETSQGSVALGGAEKITDCQPLFPATDRNKWHNFNGEFYFIDASGRPARAYADLPPVVPQARANACQTRIGQWGDREDLTNDYDGGHLIGSQLGGWGGRANVVPQDANFNRGNWAALENKMADCRHLPPGQMRYSIAVEYPNDSALVPARFSMQIEHPAQGTGVAMTFENVDRGGPDGPAEKARGVSFLDANGCR